MGFFTSPVEILLPCLVAALSLVVFLLIGGWGLVSADSVPRINLVVSCHLVAPRLNHNDIRCASHPNPRADRTNARYTDNSNRHAQCIILSGYLALSSLQRYQQLSYPARHHI